MNGANSTNLKRVHPGKGKYKARFYNKGRQLDPEAIAAIRALLENQRPLLRDRLIEYLHLIQDEYRCLSAVNISALASEMKLSETEVYEVATFYAHFDVLKEGQDVPPEVTVRVCDGIACQLGGAASLLKDLQSQQSSGFRVLPAPCMGRCEQAPVAGVGHNYIGYVTTDQVIKAVINKAVEAEKADYIDFDAYVDQGGYQLLQSCLSGERDKQSIISELEDSGLQGLGGAGFLAGRKWRIVRGFDDPRLMAVNADEGEPGTFKDRYYLETDPHRFLEGMLIAAYVVGIEKSYIYVRDEYPAIVKLIKYELEKLKQTTLANHVEIEVRRGAGAYICGEESAMIESIEGKRGLPRNRPPYVAEVGLFGRPTLEHNVETLFWIRDIVEKGANWFSGAGVNGRKGWRSYSVSGRVKNPGVKFAPAGVTIQQLIDDYCGGMQPGHVFKGYLPGGASGGILPATMNDIPLDFGTLQQYDCFIGSAAVVIFSEVDNMQDVALNLMRFFQEESCGQCTPCRVGTEKAVRIMEKDKWDTDLLQDISQVMTDASICGLGQAAGNPINCVLKYFPEDVA